MIRYLIWDVDGTLFDTYPALAGAIGAALVDLGAAAPVDEITALAKVSLTHCATTLTERFGLDPDDLGLGFQRHYADISPESQPPFPGVKGICERARSEGGANVIVTHRGAGSLGRLLDVHGMRHYFVDWLTADDDFPRKPDPAMYEEMIKRHNFKRQETLAVGDRDIDIAAGKTAGVHTCFFGPGPGEADADFSITDYAELYRCLGWDGR